MGCPAMDLGPLGCWVLCRCTCIVGSVPVPGGIGASLQALIPQHRLCCPLYGGGLADTA